jgi:hypothetical protein
MPELGASGHWVSDGERAWRIETLWQAADGLPVEQVPVHDIKGLDEDCWFRGGGNTPSVRAVVEHARGMLNADPELPIILSADGEVFDGMHRIGRALLDDRSTLPAKRLPVDPDPDWLISDWTPGAP